MHSIGRDGVNGRVCVCVRLSVLSARLDCGFDGVIVCFLGVWPCLWASEWFL